MVTPQEFLGMGEGGRLGVRRELHGAFGGAFGGGLAAVAVATARTEAPGRVPTGVDCRFLRGLPAGPARVTASVLRSGRSASVVSVDIEDDDGRLATRALVSLADRAALHPVDVGGGAQLPAAEERPWQMPAGVEIPIVATLAPRVVRLPDGALGVVFQVPWEGGAEEAACLAGDLCVGPPVAAAFADRWVPHPNPDLSLRFTGAAVADDVVGVGRLAGIAGGVAAVTVDVVSGERRVAVGVATSLLLGEG